MKRGLDLAIELPGLYLVHQNLPGKEVDQHVHDEHLLFFPLHGEIQVHLEKSTLSCGPGRMIYVPPATQHAFESSDKEGERLIALLGPKVWKKHKLPKLEATLVAANQLCKELLFYMLLHKKTKHAPELVDLFARILAEVLQTSEGVHASQLNQLEGRARDPRLLKALAFLRANVNEPPPASALAEHAGMSLRNLNRLFLQELGLTPKQVATSLRIEHAKTLLLEGRVSVTEAALSSGYQSLSQFITVFRQVTGQLPSEIRRFGQK
ncbi:MAG TPA: AraC family transcriptional regulator [Bdellovibrionales bacterium]|nr:AraC family transcriptional regulator [Bdellovibrionales bacterium]